MPVAPILPEFPKYFPDLQGENKGRTPYAGWYQNDLLPWIHNQDSKKLVAYGIGMFLLAGTVILLAFGIHKCQDQIQELSEQVTQPIKDALEPLGNNLGEVKNKIFDFLGNIKEKFMSLPWAFSSTTDVEDNGHSDNGHSADGISIVHH